MDDDQNPTPNPLHDASDDERIDALARAAAGELRRPAPADGIARIERAKRRRQATQLGGAGVAVVAILTVGAFAIGGGDVGPTVVPATVSTIDTTDTTTPDTTVPETVPGSLPDTVPETTEPPFITLPTPDSVPPNAAGSPTVLYTSVEPAVYLFGSEITTVDPLTGETTGTFLLDDATSEVSRAAQDALNGSTAMEPRISGGSAGTARNGQVDSGWFTYEFDVGELVYAFDIRPTEIQDLDQFSSETLGRFDRCGQSRVRVTGATDVALPDFAYRVTVSSDARWVATTSVACDEPGTLADGPSNIERPRIVTIFDAARPAAAGRVLADDVEPSASALVTFSSNDDFVSIDDRFFGAADGADVDVVPTGCDASGTKWSRFIGPWLGESSVALQLRCADRSSLLVRDLASGEEVEIPVSVPGDTYGFTADVDRDHYDRPANVWYTACVIDYSGGSTTTSPASCVIGQGLGSVTTLPGVAQASFLPLGFEYGG